MASRNMTLEQAVSKVSASLRALRRLNELTPEERKQMPSRGFGEDYDAIYWCLFDKRPELKAALPGPVAFGTGKPDAPPKQSYLEFLGWYEQLATLLKIEG